MSGRRLEYKWVALSNTTLAMLAYSVNQTIVLVALPAIFTGLHVDPLSRGGAGYLLWLMSGYTAATTVLLASFGRIADIHGKVRFYKIGFLVFGVASLLCALTPSTGEIGVLELIVFRVVQGGGGAMLSATSLAIITDAFPATQRGLAIGINQLAFVGGNVIGVVLGGLLAAANWRLVFLVSVPIGLGGAAWSHYQLRDTGTRTAEPPDWWGNLAFGGAMVLLMLALTYALVPYGNASTGWSNPLVLLAFLGGSALMLGFFLLEARVAHPMFNLALLRIRTFATANVAAFFFAVSRGGLQFILIIWLQAIWLPLHGVQFSAVPLEAGLALLPMMLGFLLAAPAGGWFADRYGATLLSTGGLLLIAGAMSLLVTLPPNFGLGEFMAYIFIVGVGVGLFAAPNSAQLMASVKSHQRGIASGMRQTLTNTGQLVSSALFLTIVIGGLSNTLPGVLRTGLVESGVSRETAAAAATLPAGTAVFAAVLGDNPIERVLATSTPPPAPAVARKIREGPFFAELIAEPLTAAMHAAFAVGALLALAGALASVLRGRRGVRDATAVDAGGSSPGIISHAAIERPTRS